MKVFCQECWWNDDWDPLTFGTEVDFSQTFFEQFKKLYRNVPAMSLFNVQCINSEYCNFVAECKNCYLIFGVKNDENVLYSHNTSFSKDTLDSSISGKLELCYETIQCENSNRLFFSKNSENCSDSYFLYECRNCVDCFACTNLRNKRFCFFNKQLTKEEYFEELDKLNLGSHTAIQDLKSRFYDLYLKTIHKHAHLVNTSNCTGNNLRNAKNCNFCFDVFGKESEDSKYTTHVVAGVKDSYDNYGISKAERVYETLAIGFDSHENSDYYFSFFVKASSNAYYSIACTACHHVFGCVGLQNKEYCILNKQYTKEEYERLVPQIMEHMNKMPYADKMGRVYAFGEFFPPELSPFAYNETIAQEYFPLTKEEAIKEGYDWKDPEDRKYEITKKTENLPDHIDDVDESILNEVIECEHKGKCNHQCTSAFKIIPQELQFYKKMHLPLPRLCSNCRHHERLSQRNTLKLWKKACMCGGEKSNDGGYRNTSDHGHKSDNCVNEFMTSYDPDREEIIYCERCYQREVS